MLRSLAKAGKKAGLLVAILCVAMTLQGCNIAAIMSAAGGLLAGLGQAFGGQTGQILGQVGQVLGGVGQAFGQQQAGVAGQLAGAIPPGGPLQNPGQTPGINPGQTGIPGINPGQTGQIPGLGQVQLPNIQDVFNRTRQMLPQGPLTAQQILQIAQQNTPDPAQAQQVAQAIIQQLQQGQGVGTPPFVPQNGQGAPAGIPLQFPPQQLAQGGGFQAGLNIANGVINLINAFRGNNNNGPVQPTPVQTQPIGTNGTPPTTQVVTRSA